MTDFIVKQIYLTMKTELNVRLPSDLPTIVPLFMIMQFLLSAEYSGFFDTLNLLIHAQRRSRE